MSAGSVYDKKELERIKSVVKQQSEAFSNYEKDSDLKQWFIIGGITIVSSVLILLAFKKYYK